MSEIVEFGLSDDLAAAIDNDAGLDECRRKYALETALARAEQVSDSTGAMNLANLLADAGRIETWLRDGTTNSA